MEFKYEMIIYIYYVFIPIVKIKKCYLIVFLSNLLIRVNKQPSQNVSIT